MLLIIRKVIFLVGLTLYIICAHSQIVTSTRNGVWADPSVWTGGTVPTSVNATQIIIDHEVEIPGALTVSVFRLVVNNKLTLKSSATLNILPDGFTDIPDLQIHGTLLSEDSATLNGTAASNTRFEPGSFYIHQQGPLGFIPFATWDRDATFIINGFKASGYINIAHSDSWKQTFGNVVYDCPEQSSFVDLNGYLRDIQGDFTVRATRNQALRLSTTQNPSVFIGGNFRIEGPSEVWMSTNGNDTRVVVQGDFYYSSTSLSYLTTRGRISLTIGGNMVVDSPAPLRMTSLSADSIGIREVSLELRQGLTISGGALVAPPPGNGKGTIMFNGYGIQPVNCSATGNSFSGNIDFVIGVDATVGLGASVLSNTSGSLLVRGRIQAGSLDTGGAIQTTNNGNIRIQGQRDYQPGSTIEYNGNAVQFIGDGHPVSPGVNLVCNNSAGVTLLRNLDAVHNFSILQGTFTAGSFSVTVAGDVLINPEAAVEAPSVQLAGPQDQQVSAQGNQLANVRIDKTGSGGVALVSPLRVSGLLSIVSENTQLQSNGFLTLTSSTDDADGTAAVGPLPVGSSITGNVTVERFMSAEGRIYRYISSPVAGSTIAGLMDDFPVTGTFTDPSTGPGIKAGAPSFFQYDESVGGLQAGWKPYPPSGLASANPLIPGRGYAAYIRNGNTPTVWDVTGILNQGEMLLPVAYTPNGEPSNGWNLVGNPYACSIDWDILGSSGWTRQDISEVIAIRDNGSGGVFHYWDGDITYSDIPNGQIASGQSFWVRATGSNPVMTIREGVKVTNGAVFYREEADPVPSFALVIRRDSIVDKAVVKVRSAASRGMDKWDGAKLDNDHFDIATLSAEGFPLAINALDKLPCDNETISLSLSDVEPGEYRVSLLESNDFEQYRYTWIDRYHNTEITFTPGIDVVFLVNGDAASRSVDRFAIRLQEPPIADTISVIAPTLICAGDNPEVIIKNSQPGIMYSFRDGHTKPISAERMGTGGDLQIPMILDSAAGEPFTWVTKARSACHERVFLSAFDMKRADPPLISVISSHACMGTPAVLTAASDREGTEFSWFETETSPDTLGQGGEFFTPELMKPKVYFVSGISPDGCATERHPVTADITAYDSARILWLGPHTIGSNYTTGNSWYYNGLMLTGDSGPAIHPDSQGIYTLKVDTLGCITADSIMFEPTSLHPGGTRPVSVYPNPVGDKLQIVNAFSDSLAVEIIDMLGQVVWSRKTVGSEWINIESLAEGIYFLNVIQSGTRNVIRFLKHK